MCKYDELYVRDLLPSSSLSHPNKEVFTIVNSFYNVLKIRSITITSLYTSLK